jgi:pyruvate formate lyase activating enzyme
VDQFSGGRTRRITTVSGSGARAEQSLRHVVASGVAYEVRTTVHPALLSGDDMLRLAGQLSTLGITRYTVQRFREAGCRLHRLPPVDTPAAPTVPEECRPSFEELSVR